MLEAIKTKEFQPDLSRSGWMRKFPQSGMVGPHAAASASPGDIGGMASTAGEETAVSTSSIGHGDVGLKTTKDGSKETVAPSDSTEQQPLTSTIDRSDATASGQSVGHQKETDTGEADGGSSDIESASSYTSSSTDSEHLGETTTVKLAAKDRQIEIPGPLFQNPKSGVLHKPGSDASSMACGLKSSSLVSLPEGSMFRWARCGKCFKGEVIATCDQAADVLQAMSKRRRET